MIPKIITINNLLNINEVIEPFASKYYISPSHRILIQPEKDELTVEQIHLMQKDIQFVFDKTVLVTLVSVDDSSSEVQNSLLKCLEEASQRIQFLFLVKNSSRLLPTILSRCSTIESHSRQAFSNREKVDYIEFFSYTNNAEVTKEKAVLRIDEYIQKALQIDLKTTKYLLTMRKLIIDNNMNPVLALDAILIFILKRSTMKLSNGK